MEAPGDSRCRERLSRNSPRLPHRHMSASTQTLQEDLSVLSPVPGRRTLVTGEMRGQPHTRTDGHSHIPACCLRDPVPFPKPSARLREASTPSSPTRTQEPEPKPPRGGTTPPRTSPGRSEMTHVKLLSLMLLWCSQLRTQTGRRKIAFPPLQRQAQDFVFCSRRTPSAQSNCSCCGAPHGHSLL